MRFKMKRCGICPNKLDLIECSDCSINRIFWFISIATASMCFTEDPMSESNHP